jgi:Arabinose-binding domain of AraC transcription regulator, N-term
VAFCANVDLKARRAPVSVGYARALLRHFGKSSEQRDLLLKGTGIRESVLGQPNADIPVSALVALAANITRRHGELWPLEAETVWSNALQGALDVATRTAPTVEHALATGARFGPIRAPFIRTRLSKTRGFVRLEISKAFAMEEAEWRAIALAVGLNVHVTLRRSWKIALHKRLWNFHGRRQKAWSGCGHFIPAS